MQLPTIRFSRDTSGFTKTLRARVEEHFKETGKTRFADGRMVFKTVFMLTLYFVPIALVTAGVTGGGWGFWLASFVTGLGLAGIGLNVMHDANHGAYSSRKWVNEFMGKMLDVVGGNADLWKIQHNVLHHTFTNIEGLDEDIDTPGLLRFTPDRPRKPIHRFQHIYAWFFYSIMSLFWITAKDWIATARYHRTGMLKRSGTSLGKMLGYLTWTKALHFGYILVLPMVLSGLPWWQILLGWVVMHLVAGLILAAIFQPAHVMENHLFEAAEKGAVLEDDPLIHQLKTTANFGTRSRLLTWLSGGLNHQVEHHLFPNICHIHFPDIAPIVKKTAEEFGLPYHSQTSFYEALKLHTRMLKTLVRPVAATN
jgi:linoleoyl-CoA desaturase